MLRHVEGRPIREVARRSDSRPKRRRTVFSARFARCARRWSRLSTCHEHDDARTREEELILHYYGEPADDSRGRGSPVACGALPRGARRAAPRAGARRRATRCRSRSAGLEQRGVGAARAGDRERGAARWLSRLFAATPRWALAGGVAAHCDGGVCRRPRSRRGRRRQRRRRRRVGTPAMPRERRAGRRCRRSSRSIANDAARAAQWRRSARGRIGNEQSARADLVAANRLFRQTAVRAGDEAIRERARRARTRAASKLPTRRQRCRRGELAALRADIEQRGIFFRVRVVHPKCARASNRLMARRRAGTDA